MNINQIIFLLVDICIYYYNTYNQKVNNSEIVISKDIYLKLANDIYNKYSTVYTDCYVKDIMILDDIFGTEYDLTDMDIDTNDMFKTIHDYINNDLNRIFYSSIPILSLSHSSIDNYVVFDSLWVKWTIDQYRLG